MGIDFPTGKSPVLKRFTRKVKTGSGAAETVWRLRDSISRAPKLVYAQLRSYNGNNFDEKSARSRRTFWAPDPALEPENEKVYLYCA